MTQGEVLEVFGLEADRLGTALTELAEPDWDLPTGCPPWRLRTLDQLSWSKVHFICTATGRSPISAQDNEQVSRLGVRWLTLG
jgi:hypothetical protein